MVGIKYFEQQIQLPIGFKKIITDRDSQRLLMKLLLTDETSMKNKSISVIILTNIILSSGLF